MTYSSVNRISYMSLFSITENKQSSFCKFITFDRSVLIPEGGFEFLGSCNGLFCFRAKPYQIMIWNPSLNGNIKTIPDVWRSGYIISIFGFGYDMYNEDYMVVYAYYAENNASLATMKQKRKLDFQGGFFYFFDDGMNRVLRRRKSCVVVPEDLSGAYLTLFSSFNLTTETAKAIALPSHEHGAAICTGLLFAGFHHKHQMEVWIMNEFGIEESWTKLVCISNLPIHHPLPRGSENTGYV
ncbi:PREDICTED: uncharacterized protein LOC109167030 [Ipomoea nil]|uniref:uncharacterized protein LOC109167030 n=1 Tax=Ipomoea nil TaxID=35883 RepID=UPI0009012AF8|nr:PREDICTED: uncharacterized protein LOC109167030 [Ipomoea nil]